MGESLYEYCVRCGRQELLRQWDANKNLALSPRDVSYGSKRSVWWCCDRGHQWQAIVKSRVEGSGCPVCTHRRVEAGENDLGILYPLMAAQWHPSKNGALSPRDILAATHRKVWWRCEKGHEWQANVESRSKGGAGCPFCTGKRPISGETDLMTLFPVLACWWHPTKNGVLRASDVTANSNRKVWWRCGLGHEWQATVASMTRLGRGCPYCSGRKVLAGYNDLATREPKLAAQWHPTLNGNLTAQMVTVGSHRKAWWQCPEGHVWQSAIYSRAGKQKCGCPICSGKRKTGRMERYETILYGK